MVMIALQSLPHTRQVIASILNICISPAITADNRATLYGNAVHHVVVRPFDLDSMVGLTHSGAAEHMIRFPKRGQTSINPRNTSLSPNIGPGHKVDKHLLPTSNIDVHPRFYRVKPFDGWVIRTCVYDIECPLLLDTGAAVSLLDHQTYLTIAASRRPADGGQMN